MLLKRNSLLAFELVTFSHTLFVLPLIFSGYMITYDRIIVKDIVLILIAAISARTIGMLLNRIIDAEIDQKNPRTATRPIPSGRASKRFLFLFLLLSSLIFFLTCSFICDFVFFLSPIPIILFAMYPYTKRFTPFCHFFLGATLFLGPIAGGVAASCNIDGFYLTLPIGIFTFFWISGFDILYALQDYNHDINNGIFSLPSIYGTKNAIITSSLCFILSIVSLVYYTVLYKSNFLSFFIILLIALNFSFQIINSSRSNYSFFRYNSYVGLLILILIISDILLI
ncbi:4-hydroxybenzoate octaprenyltransferase [bacterium]|jgi:4-hydroxybenzoate polyprenyltransferase|nr:4-hydroxybenzoate octaprenyltransferase [bacterium]MBT3795163.1 4-hydroxybenzoate octaprenyltransferase [bacterium]MBT4634187.1 4-hydroxybenzoate octaprenyltransferase [bacterium]